MRLLLLFLLLPACMQPQATQAPNFIILFADDLGYGDLGCFGHPTIETPHLDQMTAEGLKLTQFYVAASICTPSRAGLLTGKLPVRMGMTGKRGVLFPDSGGGLPPDETTLAEALKELDYQTACIGKWHLGHLPEFLPTKQGFDSYFGIPYSNDMRPESNWDYARENFPPLPLMEGSAIIDTLGDQSQLTQLYTQKAIDFIEQHQDQPFFLYLAHTFPHVPLYIDRANKGRSKRGLYGDVVEVLDESVGDILATLKRLKLAENTFVLFTSDNGPWGWAGINGGSAGLLRGAKGSPWEGGYRVPAIAWMPGTIPANSRTEALASTLDLFPTLLSMAGAGSDAYAGQDAWDISATFTEQKNVRRELLYFRQSELVAIRQGPWKLFLRDPNPWNEEYTEDDLPLLYHIDSDPAEKFNLAEKQSGIVQKLSSLARTRERGIAPVPSQLDIIIESFRENYEKYQNR